MVYRRRSTNFGLKQLACSGLLLALGFTATATQAGSSLEILPGASNLRFALPDAVYANGVVANFANLQVTDAAGRNQPYAACPLHKEVPETIAAAVLAIPDIARPSVDTQGVLSLDVPKGARLANSANDWVIDLRHAGAPIRQLDGLPAIRQLRSSPNLQQWSAAIAIRQNGSSVAFDPVRAPYLRLSLAQYQDVQSAPALVTAHLEKFSGQRARHLFTPERGENGVFLNPRSIPILAARIGKVTADTALTLQSRQGEWDAWKSRGQLSAGQAEHELIFSAVTDPQWRIHPATSAELHLAHAAYELRLPQVDPGVPLFLRIENSMVFGPQLSCLNTLSLAQQAPAQIKPIVTTASEHAGRSPTNLRLGFLIGLLAAVIVAIFGWRLRKSLLSR